MFFATIWAFIMGKNAVENGIKDAKLNKWSKQNAVNPATNTYIDAKGMTRDINSNAVVFIERTLDGHMVKKDIFGNVIYDYTTAKTISDFNEAKAKQDPFHTVVERLNGTYQDLNEPHKSYVIQIIHVNDMCSRRRMMDIPVYVDTKTALIERPIDEYMEFISHEEYYKNLKERLSCYPKMYIRDKVVINEIIKQKNESLIYGEMFVNWTNYDGLKKYQAIKPIENYKKLLELKIAEKMKELKTKSCRRRLEASGKALFV